MLSLTLRSASWIITQQRASEYKILTFESQERLTLPSGISFAELCPLDPEKCEMALFLGTNYYTYVHVGIQSNEATQLNFRIDNMSNGSYFVCILYFHLIWAMHIKRSYVLKPRSAKKQPISSEKVILLHLQIWSLWIRVWFGVVDNLAVDLLGNVVHQEIYARNYFNRG